MNSAPSYFAAALIPMIVVGGCDEVEQSGPWQLEDGEERADFRGAARRYLRAHGECFSNPDGIDESARVITLIDRVEGSVLETDLKIVRDDLTFGSRIPVLCSLEEKSREEREIQRLKVQSELDREWKALDRATTRAFEVI